MGTYIGKRGATDAFFGVGDERGVVCADPDGDGDFEPDGDDGFVELVLLLELLSFLVVLGLTTTSWGCFELLSDLRVTTRPSDDRCREDDERLFFSFSGLVLLEQSWCLVLPHRGHGGAPME
jgi:hypothetical protein